MHECLTECVCLYFEFCYSVLRLPDVDDECGARACAERRDVVRVAAVPRDARQRHELGALVDDRGVLQRTEVEQTHRAVGARRDERVARMSESDVEHFLVMRLDLRPCLFDVVLMSQLVQVFA